MYEVENMDFEEIAEMSFEEMESETRLQQLAVEIVTFDRQAKITAVSCAIEIGERLLEAKELVPHGEWGNWLKKNVNYSQSTANNFMRLYKEYGNDQGSLFTTLTNSQTIMNLDVSKALALTVLPPEEREEFVSEHDVESMSTRDLKEALQENKELKQQQQQLKHLLEEKERQATESASQLDIAISERQRMQDKLNESVNRNAGYEKSLQLKIDAAKRLEAEKKAAEEKQKESEKKAQELQRKMEELENQKPEVDQQVIGELQAEAEKQAERRFAQEIEKLRAEKEKAEQRAAEAEEKNRQLQSKANSEQSKELIVFDEKFKSFQDSYNQINQLIAKKEGPTADKVRGAVRKLLSVMEQKLG